MSDDIKFFLLVIFAIFILCSAALIGISQMMFPGQRAMIEQLRADATNPALSCQVAEDIAGQVTAANQEISQAKAYNDRWWSDLYVPDGWNKLELIPVPHNCG